MVVEQALLAYLRIASAAAPRAKRLFTSDFGCDALDATAEHWDTRLQRDVLSAADLNSKYEPAGLLIGASLDRSPRLFRDTPRADDGPIVVSSSECIDLCLHANAR